MKRSIALTLIAGAISAEALLPSQNPRSQLVNTLKSTVVEQKEAGVEESESKNNKPRSRSSSEFWRITSSTFHPQQRPLTSDLIEAMEMNTHPKESQEELGQGLSIESDWRENWYTYESPADDPDLIDDATGYSEYECEVEGNLPDELQGTLYRNGPGKFGVNGERVQHVLDADALVYKIDFPAPDTSGERKVKFLSRFVSTPQFEAEQKANKFLYRGTFGTGPSFEGLDSREKNGLNTDPEEPSILSKVVGGAFNTDIKSKSTLISRGVSFERRHFLQFILDDHQIPQIPRSFHSEEKYWPSLKQDYHLVWILLPWKLSEKIPWVGL